MDQGSITASTGHPRGRQIIGLLLGPGLVYAYVIWLSINTNENSYSDYGSPWRWLYGLFIYAVVIAGWLALVYQRVCRRRLPNLNRKPGSLSTDLALALGLFVVVFISGHVVSMLQGIFWPLSSSGAVEAMYRGLLSNPLTVFILLGPYSFLAAGMMEELTRVFLLERALALWPGLSSTALLVAVSAALFAACHIYQGPVGVVDNAIFGLWLALFYVIFGRILPMILAHGMYGAVLLIEGMLWTQYYGVN